MRDPNAPSPAPLSDPFAYARGPHAAGAPAAPRASVWAPVLVTALLAGAIGAGAVYVGSTRAAATSKIEVRPTNDVLVAVKDLSRLEVTEIRVEKVVDLTDKQTRLFGYLETQDSMLLVASGTAIVGVDLEKMKASYDAEKGVARLDLPEPETLSVSLDPDATYVYRRDTGVLAKRNEQLEANARKEAHAAIERAANEEDVKTRAKKQAERQLTALLKQAGAKDVEIRWNR
ncbi:MAG TPA: DUF4230 domain-containing protein [Polyangiaceae bacterium]|nr:DUF4230 domain-containing protein [Polyangiaceae bacterium]